MKFIERGVAKEVVDVDISDIAQPEIDRIRAVLLQTPIVVLKKQTTEALHYARFIHRLSANKRIENWERCYWYEDGTNSEHNSHTQMSDIPYKNPLVHKGMYPVQRVNSSKEKSGAFRGVFQGKRLDWHCNLNNVNHADGVAIQGFEHCEGTRTDFNNTVLAYSKMPTDLKEKIQNRWCEYEYVYSKWADISSMTQMFLMSGRHDIMKLPGYDNKYKFWLKQKNIGGIEGVYFFPMNNARIQDDEDRKIFKELREYLYQPKFVYEHNWEVGDIVLSDQLLSQHKRPILSDEWEKVLEKRVLHRYTFMISQPKIPQWNNFDEV